MNQHLLVILGPTACGKTRLAAQLAYQLKSEVISADSRQVYRDMNIGTGKDTEEYTINGKQIPYHLIDIAEAGEAYHVYRFQQDCRAAIDAVRARGRMPILCGGTGLYIEAVLKEHQFTAIPVDDNLRAGLQRLSDEELLATLEATPSAYTPLADTSTRKRLIRAIEISVFLQENQLPVAQHSLADYKIFGLHLPVEERRARITRRLYARLQHGLVEEVERLLTRGISPETLIYYGLEYKFITEYLTGTVEYGTMVERLNVAIHQFAKRQMTFFRKMERDGLQIHWLDALLPTEDLVKQITAEIA